MKTYSPVSPLISLHIPKCAGQSLRWVLQQWFGDRFFIHYFQQQNALPPKHPLGPGVCIHGHFNRNKNLGVSDYYPAVDQFLTVLRDPLETAISNYFFWKRKARLRQLELGVIKKGDPHDYRDINDFFLKRPKSTLLNFMPDDVNFANYKDMLETKFVWIGIVEDLQASIEVLARRLGFSPVHVEHLNAFPRDESLSSELAEHFTAANRLEFEIYRYALEHHYRTQEGKC